MKRVFLLIATCVALLGASCDGTTRNPENQCAWLYGPDGKRELFCRCKLLRMEPTPLVDCGTRANNPAGSLR